MMMPHPLIPVSLPPASVTMAMSQMNHLSTIANMAAAAQGQSLPSRMVTSVIKVNFNTQKSNNSGISPKWFCLVFRQPRGYLFCLCAFVVAGLPGTCAGQPVSCTILRRQQEAREPPLVPPQQQCV